MPWPARPKLPHQLRILELSDDVGSDPERVEPVVEAAPELPVGGRGPSPKISSA
jgi:hypothetical protein